MTAPGSADLPIGPPGNADLLIGPSTYREFGDTILIPDKSAWQRNEGCGIRGHHTNSGQIGLAEETKGARNMRRNFG